MIYGNYGGSRSKGDVVDDTDSKEGGVVTIFGGYGTKKGIGINSGPDRNLIVT